MDELLIRSIKDLQSLPLDELERDLLNVLASQAGGRLTVAEARVRLRAVLRQVRSGAPQLVGKRKDPVAFISLQDLVALIYEQQDSHSRIQD